MSRPYFSIFIPSFNRADLIGRALASIEAQSERDVEVIVVDDGSTDGTRDVVESWARGVPFRVSYHWQPNQGKAAAYNAALPRLQGLLTVVLDSDDVLAPESLARLRAHWESIPPGERRRYAGIEGHAGLIRDGSVSGDTFPSDRMVSNALEIRHRYRIRGDKKGAHRTDVLQRYPYPLFPGERHVRESVVWNRFAHEYRTLYLNEVFQLIEYQPQGLSATMKFRRTTFPRGMRLAFMEMLNLHGGYLSFAERFGYAARYVRYSLHAGVGLSRQGREVDDKLAWLLAVPRGCVDWARDRVRMRFRPPPV